MKIEHIIKKIRLHPLYWTWTSDDDTIGVLTALAQQKTTTRILELGTFTGYTTMNLLLHSGGSTHIDTVDMSDHSSEYFSLLSKEDAARLHFSEMSTSDFFAQCPKDRKYDLVFVDADHAYHAVLSDLGGILCHIDNGSVIVFHDTDSDLFPGVKQALVLFEKFFFAQVPLGFFTGNFEWRKVTNKNGTPGGIVIFRIETHSAWYVKMIGRALLFFAHNIHNKTHVTKESLQSDLQQDVQVFGQKEKKKAKWKVV